MRNKARQVTTRYITVLSWIWKLPNQSVRSWQCRNWGREWLQGWGLGGHRRWGGYLSWANSKGRIDRLGWKVIPGWETETLEWNGTGRSWHLGRHECTSLLWEIAVEDASVFSISMITYNKYFISLPVHSSANNSSCHQSADSSSAHPWGRRSDIVL